MSRCCVSCCCWVSRCFCVSCCVVVRRAVVARHVVMLLSLHVTLLCITLLLRVVLSLQVMLLLYVTLLFCVVFKRDGGALTWLWKLLRYVVVMPFKLKRVCSICYKPNLLQLNHHLRQVHRLSYLKNAVFSHPMSMNNIQKPAGEKLKRQNVKPYMSRCCVSYLTLLSCITSL